MRSAITVLSLIVAASLFAQSKLTTQKTGELLGSAWLGNPTCGGLKATMWSDGKGWHEAGCMEMATKLSELRDVHSVTVSYGKSIGGLLAFPQDEHNFRISRKDFEVAQEVCKPIVEGGYAHPDVLAHCKAVVNGIVPFGLKLKD